MVRRHELLSPVDAAWFRMDASEDPADVAAVLFLDGRVDEARLRRTLEERLLVHPRFRQRVVDRGRIAAPEWQDDDRFSLATHVRSLSLHAGDDVAEVISRLVSRPMRFAHSPWSATVLHRASGDDALFVRLHHCLGDGFALLDALVSLADGHEGAENDVARPPPVTPPPSGQGALRSLGHILAMPFDPPTFLRDPLSGNRRVTWTERFELAALKDAARARGVTLNDLLMAAVAGSLRRYLLAREGVISPLRAIVPVNLRPPGTAIDWTKGNWFGLVFLDLPVHAETERERLDEVHRAMETIKHGQEAAVTLGILNVMGRVPIVVDRIIESIFAHKASVVVTNVPGPPAPLRIAGAPIRDIVFWVPHPCGLGLGISILSYAGGVRVGLRADVAVVPDPELLARFFAEDVAELTSRGEPS